MMNKQFDLWNRMLLSRISFETRTKYPINHLVGVFESSTIVDIQFCFFATTIEAHLLPQINLFGFCNQDIMFLSGVQQKQKESVFRGFWKRLLERYNQLTKLDIDNS
jgi:hypothetical protein